MIAQPCGVQRKDGSGWGRARCIAAERVPGPLFLSDAENCNGDEETSRTQKVDTRLPT